MPRQPSLPHVNPRPPGHHIRPVIPCHPNPQCLHGIDPLRVRRLEDDRDPIGAAGFEPATSCSQSSPQGTRIKARNIPKSNWDCTICRSCRWGVSGVAGVEWRGNRFKWRMWTPPDGQARFQNRVGGSLVRYCRMSGLLMRPLLAAGPYGVREIGSKSDKRARRPSAIYWFFRSRLVDRLPLLRSCVLLSPSPGSVSLLSPFSFRWPVRRQCEPGRSPFSWSAPRPSVPSCWRAPPRPPSSACVPTSRPATDP